MFDHLSAQLLPRGVQASLIVVFALALGLGPPALAQQRKAAAAAEVSVEELMKPGPLPDVVVGKSDAPVTIVEYASMTCPHCAVFHNTVLPKLKEKYIEPGQVRLIFREFPLDNLAAAASMLTRCAGLDKTAELTRLFFEKQDAWAFTQGNPLPGLFTVAEGAGFTKASFDACLKDQKALEGVTQTRDRATKVLNVRSTPTFFINGKRLEGRSDQIETFEAALQPLLKN